MEVIERTVSKIRDPIVSVVHPSQIHSRMKRSARSLDADNAKAEGNVDAEDNKKRKKVRFEKSLDNKSAGKSEKRILEFGQPYIKMKCIF